ncbi:hypothetical protein ACWXWU_06280 [Shewanella sp. A14]
MKTSATLTRHDVKNDPLSFYSLRKTGIKYAQAFSGDIWTDYNAHDPGVTILEQLCYGLTELNYRTEFNVEDHLSEPDGYLNLTTLALAPPEEALPARACTVEDYRNLLLDGIEEIDRVWISAQASAQKGLYNIELQLTPSQRALCQARPSLMDKIINKVSLVYGKHRNLGEDIGEISIIADNGYQLHADIELSDNVSAESVMAKIYHVSQQWLMGELVIETYEEQIKQGKSLEAILTGPRTQHGYYKVLDSQTRDRSTDKVCRTLSSLYSVIRTLEGIETINHLALKDVDESLSRLNMTKDQEKETQDPGNTNPQEVEQKNQLSQVIRDKSWLLIPDDPKNIKVCLQRHRQTLNIDFETFKSHVEHRQFKQYSMRHTRQEVSSLYQAVQGRYRQVKHYHSVQQHFPVHYNLSLMGIQASADPLDKAKANQLKGYMLIFDQLMANFSSNINNLKNLFSIDKHYTQTYQFYSFDSINLPGIERFYPKTPKQTFDELLAKFDHFYDRKGRVLDYLLALYGETLDQRILRQFNAYDSQQGLEAVLLDNKYQYLTSVLALGRDRGAGFDYRSYREFTHNIGGFQFRLSSLLGLQVNQWPYTSLIKRQPLDIVTDAEFEQLNASHHNQVILNDAMAKDFIPITLINSSIKQDEKSASKVFLSLLPLKNNVIGETFFRKGVDITHFKLVKRGRLSQYDLFFTLQQKQELSVKDARLQHDTSYYLGSSSDTNKANRLANIIREHLVLLNRKCEGIYVVEHLLLRPETRTDSNITLLKPHTVEEDFYSLRVSIIFPNFTARCADKGYQKMAQEIVTEQCPAHIYPQCYWLGFAQLCEFEQTYMKWLELRRSGFSPSDECQQSAQQLVDLLKSYQKAQGLVESTTVTA